MVASGDAAEGAGGSATDGTGGDAAGSEASCCGFGEGGIEWQLILKRAMYAMWKIVPDR